MQEHIFVGNSYNYSNRSRSSLQAKGGFGTFMIHIISSIIVGFVVGLLARAIMPGDQHMGFIATTFIGIIGSVVGGLLSRLFSKPADGSFFHPAGFLLSIVGAFLLLLVLMQLR